jgi:hypothetical protein
MKLRPQFNLRFRDADQFVDVKTLADEEGVPMNEWLLRQIEKVPLLKGGRIAEERRVAKKGAPGATKAQTSAVGAPEAAVGLSTACSECFALGGLHQRGCKNQK